MKTPTAPSRGERGCIKYGEGVSSLNRGLRMSGIWSTFAGCFIISMAGIYIHIPFCKSRCKYCDFYSTTALNRRKEYVSALLAEYEEFTHHTNNATDTNLSPANNTNLHATDSTNLHYTDNTNLRTSDSTNLHFTDNTNSIDDSNTDTWAKVGNTEGAFSTDWALFEEKNIKTIYLGGGTPSVLETEDLLRLAKRLPFRTAQEITIECNPGDITPEKAAAWRAMGVNRLSIGIQSFDDSMLQRIGRRHTAAQARAAVQIAQAAGFDNISIDLIYGLPTLPHEDGLALLQADIDAALSLGVQHLSAYCLSYEEGTPLTRMLRQGEITETDEDTENRMFDLLAERLQAAGYQHYEVSNYALPGYRSQHNSSYWNNTPYLGLGAAAHSYDGNQRWWNTADLEKYIQQSLAHSLVREKEQLTADNRYDEAIMLGLRTSEGIPYALLRSPAAATPYIERGLLQCTGEPPRLVATREGMHVLNTIICDLLG